VVAFELRLFELRLLLTLGLLLLELRLLLFVTLGLRLLEFCLRDDTLGCRYELLEPDDVVDTLGLEDDLLE
jgi:hypothetical protein